MLGLMPRLHQSSIGSPTTMTIGTLIAGPSNKAMALVRGEVSLPLAFQGEMYTRDPDEPNVLYHLR